MTDPLEQLRAMAPQSAVNPDGLARARALFESARQADSAGPVVDMATMRPSRHRMTRRIALIGSAAAVLTVAGVGVSALWPTSTSPGQGTSAAGIPVIVPAAAEDRCRTDSLAPATSSLNLRTGALPGEVAQAAHLLAGEGPRAVTVTEDTYACGRPLAAAVYYAEDGSAGITLYANVADPFAHATTSKIDVRGHRGRAMTPPAGHHFVSWVESDGVRWLAIANGMSTSDLVHWLAGAKLDGTEVPLSTTVTGMSRAPTASTAGSVIPAVTYTWEADYGAPLPTTDTGGVEALPRGYVSLQVVVGPSDPVTSQLSWGQTGDVVTSVDGEPAVYTPNSEGGSLLRWAHAGATYLLFVNAHSLDTSLGIADRVQPVAVDDPRVIAAGL